MTTTPPQQPPDPATSSDGDLSHLLPPAPIHDRLGIELVSVHADRVVARMPVSGNTQPLGLLHGGASLVLAESVGSIGAVAATGGAQIAVGIEINASHHRSATAGHVTAVGVPIHHGRTLSTWDVEIRDDDDRLICTARLTCLLRERPPGSSVPVP